MQCVHCLTAERRRVAPAPAASREQVDAIERADRRSQLVCASCGGPLAPGGSLRERLVQRLAQLGRFGLTADAGPLLESGRHRS